MPHYRIYRLKESQRRHFRDGPPAPGPHELKRRDYEAGDEVEAPSPYDVWQQARAGQAIEVGDALETDTGALVVCRYVGFEEARWWSPPEPPAVAAPETPPAG